MGVVKKIAWPPKSIVQFVATVSTTSTRVRQSVPTATTTNLGAVTSSVPGPAMYVILAFQLPDASGRSLVQVKTRRHALKKNTPNLSKLKLWHFVNVTRATSLDRREMTSTALSLITVLSEPAHHQSQDRKTSNHSVASVLSSKTRGWEQCTTP
jgi:hypothetical protein